MGWPWWKDTSSGLTLSRSLVEKKANTNQNTLKKMQHAALIEWGLEIITPYLYKVKLISGRAQSWVLHNAVEWKIAVSEYRSSALMRLPNVERKCVSHNVHLYFFIVFVCFARFILAARFPRLRWQHSQYRSKEIFCVVCAQCATAFRWWARTSSENITQWVLPRIVPRLFPHSWWRRPSV